MTGRHITGCGLLLAALVLVPAAESVAQSRTRTKRTPRCYRVDVSSPESPAKRRRRPSFSAAKIMDIQLEAYVSRRLTGQHKLEFKIFTPKGNLYQTMELPFDADAPVAEDSHRVNRRYQRVSTILPVAGTSIVSSSIYGTWTIEAYLDGHEKTCSRPRKFEIEP